MSYTIANRQRTIVYHTTSSARHCHWLQCDPVHGRTHARTNERTNEQVKEVYSCLWKSIAQLRSVTCHMGSHSVTFHPTQVSIPRRNPSHTGRYSIYLLFTIEGWVDLGGLLHTEMVYPPADGHPSKYRAQCRLTSLIKQRRYPLHHAATNERTHEWTSNENLLCPNSCTCTWIGQRTIYTIYTGWSKNVVPLI